MNDFSASVSVPGSPPQHLAALGGSHAEPPAKVTARDLNFYYGDNHALKNIDITLGTNRVTAFIGPSGCGKSTFIRALDRMHDLTPGARVSGRVLLDGADIYAADIDPVTIRHRIGMVFQRPNPFPKSIFDNVTYGPVVHGERRKNVLNEICERSLRRAALWDEVKDRLNHPAVGLSGGQQQRLCIARALAIEPEVLLMDEPASALDPIATGKVEELICDLKRTLTIVIVTHNMQQAARVSDFTAFFYLGELIEFAATEKIFTNPNNRQTEDYVSGRFG